MMTWRQRDLLCNGIAVCSGALVLAAFLVQVSNNP